MLKPGIGNKEFAIIRVVSVVYDRSLGLRAPEYKVIRLGIRKVSRHCVILCCVNRITFREAWGEFEASNITCSNSTMLLIWGNEAFKHPSFLKSAIPYKFKHWKQYFMKSWHLYCQLLLLLNIICWTFVKINTECNHSNHTANKFFLAPTEAKESLCLSVCLVQGVQELSVAAL